MRSSTIFAPLVALAITLSAGSARADDDDWAEAGKLFHEARALMQKPDGLNKACELFTKSYELRQRGDTLLNLAECHRRQGKTATAWREFDEAIKYAEKVEFKEAIEAAVKLRDELAAKLSAMMVEVESAPEGIEVVLDGKPLPSAQWGQPLFVDPGTHSVSASAKGYESFSQSVEVSQRGGERAVIKIELKKIPEKPKAPPPKPPPPKPPPPPPPAPEPEVPIWAIVVGSAGIAMMGVSIGFGVDVVSVGGELDDECGDERDDCPADYDFESARSQELRSFGLFVGFGTAGIIAAGVGAIGLGVGLSSDAGDSEKPAVSLVPWGDFGGGGIAVRGVIE